MSSLNPVVGVSLCIGALGAGLAYLAWNNQDDEDDQTTNEKVNTTEENYDDVGEKNDTVEKNNDNTEEKNDTVEEKNNEKKDVELKTIKVSKVSNDVAVEETTEKQSKMKQFLKESYENAKQN